METACKEPREWEGAVGFRLGEQLFVDCSHGSIPSAERVADLAERIKSARAKHDASLPTVSLKHAASSVLSQRLGTAHRRSSLTPP
jgi:hypothetical protein